MRRVERTLRQVFVELPAAVGVRLRLGEELLRVFRAAQRAQNSTRAQLVAFDGVTGRELWSSGEVMASHATQGSLSSGGGRVYVGDATAHGVSVFATAVPGERQLEYEVVLGSFEGDWYAAAERYRQWSHRQPWAGRPLHRRRDVPGWLLDSPPHSDAAGVPM